jgi:hypothetical protein
MEAIHEYEVCRTSVCLMNYKKNYCNSQEKWYMNF